MKKLMFVAALAASTAAFADCAPDPVPGPAAYCAQVYSVKMSVKTTKGVVTTTKTVSDGNICNPGEIPGTCLVYRTKDSTTFTGYIADCDCSCGLLATVGSEATVVWDSKRKAPMAGAAFTTTFLNVMGKKQTEAEWAWTFAGTADYGENRTQAYSLTGAGYGKYDTKNDRYTSFSGNFAGTATASYDLKAKVTETVTCACDPSVVAKCDDLGTLTADDTVAYGTWSVKYNASLSKKFASKKWAAVKLPSYVLAALGE